MDNTYEEKSSRLPFIQYLWRANVAQVGKYDDIAKETWGLAFTKHVDGSLAAELLGPSYSHRVLESALGDEYWGVEFYSSVTMIGVDKPKLTGKLVPLLVIDGNFFIGENSYTIPSFEELEAFCDNLEKQGIILYISNSLEYQGSLSLRSNQRHYRKTVGLTRTQSSQIRRAKLASTLLQGGTAPMDAALEAGYADQAHMTRSLKSLLGKTPAQIKHLD